MTTLEQIIEATLEKYKQSQINISSPRARSFLAEAIASEIRERVAAEKKGPAK